MAIKSGFFMSVDGDRKYNADFFANYFASFIGNGVFPEPSTGMQVIANNDMSVTLKEGKGWINGYVAFNDDDYILELDPADGVLNRIDRIVLRWDSVDREINVQVKKGEFASSPVAKALQRDTDAYELALADVYVGKGAISITQANITDIRLNNKLCGIVHGVVDQVDTTSLFNQYQTWYEETTGQAETDIEDIKFNFIRDWNNWYDATTNEFEAEFTTWFDRIKGMLEEDVGTRLSQEIIEINDRLDEFAKGTNKFKVGNTENFKAVARGGLKIEISLGDPVDSIIVDESGKQVTLAKWAGTMVRGKLNSYPVDPSDGELIFDNKERNKYKQTPFSYEYLNNGDKWYFMAFPYTEKDVYTIDASNRDKATATNKLNQPAPPAPSISNLEFDRATVTGGDLVSLDKVSWHNSPHTFTGLTEETTYTAYAKKKETANYLESPISVGKTFKTPSDLPGPSDLIAGDMQAGYFGVVPASELFTGAEISSMTGISNGTLQFGDVGWLKFAIDGKIIYKSQKPYRHTISWDDINAKGCVDGTKQIAKDGTTFRVRLMKGALTDPGNYPASDRGAKGSEWNRLMLPIHVKAKDKSWAYPAYVEGNIPYWGVDFTDADLQTHNSHGDGSRHWCQETTENASSRVIRGYNGVSYSNWYTSSNASAYSGWSPVLEVVS